MRARLIVRLEGIWSISRTRDWTISISPYRINIVWRHNNNKYAENRCYQIYFSLFIFSFPPEKEKNNNAVARFNCVSQLHIALISQHPMHGAHWLSLSHSQPLSIIFYLRINSPKNCTHTLCACVFLNNPWMVRIFLRIALCLFFVAVVFFYSHPILFSHTLTIQSKGQGERERASSISISDEL